MPVDKQTKTLVEQYDSFFLFKKHQTIEHALGIPKWKKND